jgi:hypothetical protein
VDPRDDEPRYGEPLDGADPRFDAALEAPPRPRRSPRELVPSQGPGPSPYDERVRILRIAVPLLALGIVVAVAAVFFIGLDPGSGVQVVGPEPAVRAAIAERPRRVCLNGLQPCAWLTVVDDELLAFNTNGPLPNEYGRLGIAWCASSGWYGSNVTGSRFDQRGHVTRGPAPRGLDRFGLVRTRQGLGVDFFSLTAGLPADLTEQTLPPDGPHCEEIPFDRDADLEL